MMGKGKFVNDSRAVYVLETVLGAQFEIKTWDFITTVPMCAVHDRLLETSDIGIFTRSHLLIRIKMSKTQCEATRVLK